MYPATQVSSYSTTSKVDDHCILSKTSETNTSNTYQARNNWKNVGFVILIELVPIISFTNKHLNLFVVKLKITVQQLGLNPTLRAVEKSQWRRFPQFGSLWSEFLEKVSDNKWLILWLPVWFISKLWMADRADSWNRRSIFESLFGGYQGSPLKSGSRHPSSCRQRVDSHGREVTDCAIFRSIML